MSVFGSLFTAVSGLTAQSDSISMISNNIANVNTVGYKKTEASFESLVTTKSNAAAYSPGSVTARQNARIDQQGILQQSASPTDIAISGNGFFIVKAGTDALSEPLYTRAGSFSEDASGILRNANGFYLQGWPIDQNGNLPASQANISSLVPVNVAFLGGLTAPTTSASLGLNLKATEAQNAYPISASTPVDFTRAIQVFDSLGTGHDLTVHFTKMTSPTSTATGTYPLNTVDDVMAGEVAGISPTDSFQIQVGTNAAVTIPAGGKVADMLSALNNVTDDVTGAHLITALLDGDGNLTIKARNLGDSFTLSSVSGSPLTALGVSTGSFTATGTGSTNVSAYSATDFSVTPGAATLNPAWQLSVKVGNGATQTFSMAGGMNQLTTNLAAAGITATVVGNNLQLTSNSGAPITLTNTTPANDVLSALGFGPGPTSTIQSTGTIAPPAFNPTNDLLTGLNPDVSANTEGWWKVEFVTPTGSVAGSGAINFLSNGSLNALSDSNQKVNVDLQNIDWSNGSDPQEIAFDIGGFTQFAGDYNVVSSVQNGAALGLRTGVTIDDQGFVIAQFSNGQSKAIYRLPIATFANINGLDAQTGNVFRESDASGSYNLREARTGGAGEVASGSLEASNVDLAEEFSKMIITQRAYSANTKVISAADQMTQDLLQIS